MNKVILLISVILLIFLSNYPLSGQELAPKNKQDNSFAPTRNIQSMLRYGIEIPFYANAIIGYEKSIGKGFSILPEVGFGALYNIIEHNNENSHIPIRFWGRVSVRKYFNINRRISKGINTANNTFPYVGLVIFYSHNPLTKLDNSDVNFDDKYSSIEFLPISWGIQRNLSKKVMLDFSNGYGLRFVLSSNSFSCVAAPFNVSLYIRAAFLFHN